MCAYGQALKYEHDGRVQIEMFPKLETFVKMPVLVTFSLLNTIDMLQSVSLLRMGIESNPFAVRMPIFWFILKATFSYVFPVALFLFDINLASRQDTELVRFLKSVSHLIYIMIIMADVFYLSIVLQNMSRLGRLY